MVGVYRIYPKKKRSFFNNFSINTNLILINIALFIIFSILIYSNIKFLQVIYLKPLSNKIKKEIQNAKKVILIENNLTGQLGRLIREKTGIKIENRILKYDGRPFYSDELKKEILKVK